MRRIDTGKLQSIALEALRGADHMSSIDHFRKMGYQMKIQMRRRDPQTKRMRLDKPPADRTKKTVWFFLEQNAVTGSRYWMGVPREVAKKALVLGFLPSL